MLHVESLNKWKDGALIQDAFPEVDKETRELIISGTHPACWQKMFGDAEDA
jgi:hypothetical protein